MSRDETPDTTGLREADCTCGHGEEHHVFTGGGFCNHCECERFAAILAAPPTPDASPDPAGCHRGYPWCDGKRPCACPCHDPAVVTPDAGDAPVLDELAALELAEEVWEDEPTDAEQELMQRVLASDWLANHVAAAREADRAEVEAMCNRAQRAEADRDEAQGLAGALTDQLAIVVDQRSDTEERLAGLVAKIEALADEFDPERLLAAATALRALIPADAATALDAVREKAKAEALRELADDIDSTGYGWTSVVDAERFKARLRERAARHTPGDGA